MKISINDKELFSLTETQKKVIMNEVPADEFEEDVERRLFYIINHKYEQCFNRLKKEWEARLTKEGAQYIPTDKDVLAELVFAHPEYKDRAARDLENKK